MRYFKIPPAATSVIALTSVAFFGQDQRDLEEMDSASKKEMVQSSTGNTAANPVQIGLESKTGGIYLVEIELGGNTQEVLVDAYTGEILRKRAITPGIA